MIRPRKTRGFTLVEILIVVVILGILAAIVIPQFTSATESAKFSSLTSQLQAIRGQLELAQIQHQGTYPDLVASGWTPMTTNTEPVTAYTAGDGTNDMGPYLQQDPINPFENSAACVAAAATGKGWEYSKTTGVIKAIMSTAKATALNVVSQTNDFATY